MINVNKFCLSLFPVRLALEQQLLNVNSTIEYVSEEMRLSLENLTCKVKRFMRHEKEGLGS